MKPKFTTTLYTVVKLIYKYFKEIILVSTLNAILFYLIYLSLPLFNNLNILVNQILTVIILYLLISGIYYLCNSLIFIIIENRESSLSLSIPSILQYIFSRLLPVLITWILYEALTLLGLLFFIIPGLVFAVSFSQSNYFTLIDGENPIVALKSSWRVMKGNRLQFMSLSLIYGIIIYIIFQSPNLFLKLPYFAEIIFSTFMINIVMIINYVIWKTLKQTPLFQNNIGITSSSSSPKRFSLVTKIIIFLIVFFVIIVPIVFILKARSSNPVDQESVKRFLDIEPSVSPAPRNLGRIENWKTYRNTKYGYEIKYPPGFSPTTFFKDIHPDVATSSSVSIINDIPYEYFSIEVTSKMDKNLTLHDDIVQYLKSRANSGNIIKETEIDGHPAIYVGNNVSGEQLRLTVYVEKDPSTLIEVILGSPADAREEDYIKVFDQSLTTLHFY